MEVHTLLLLSGIVTVSLWSVGAAPLQPLRLFWILLTAGLILCLGARVIPPLEELAQFLTQSPSDLLRSVPSPLRAPLFFLPFVMAAARYFAIMLEQIGRVNASGGNHSMVVRILMIVRSIFMHIGVSLSTMLIRPMVDSVPDGIIAVIICTLMPVLHFEEVSRLQHRARYPLLDKYLSSPRLEESDMDMDMVYCIPPEN
jgi:hypothetical protein